ncbi:MAG: hypothetical protein JO061_21925 [Acidobacteriaceae bacterium]|nr:hypothetical protein [Acidobacteriaceae bacterium]
MVRNIAPIVASAAMIAFGHAAAAQPPPGLLKKIAQRQTESAQARENYTYRQSLTIQEFDDRGVVTGEYREVRDVTFSPNRVRYEQIVERPRNTLTRIKLTAEDFADIRNIQPFFLTSEQLRLYEAKYKGEETIDGVNCWVEYVQPRQILSRQRFFQGTLWVRESDFAVIRTEGQAVPQIETLKQQNLFPHFTTLWREVDGRWLFPEQTYADDTLFFRSWPQRIRIIIRYINYKRFGAESTITFGDPEAQK